MIYIGIDPGVSGAVAAVDGNHPYDPSFYDTPTLQIKSGKSLKNVIDVKSAADILRRLKGIDDVYVIIEKVWAMTKGIGGATMGATSAFNFGMGFGMWLGIITTLNMPHEQVAPVTWKRRMMGDMEKEKDASRLRAMQLFPQSSHNLNLKKHHGRADALLLAEFGRRFSV
jgi:crossover junction endodeoxyribonuclease RuvC